MSSSERPDPAEAARPDAPDSLASDARRATPVAIVGMSCLFPGAQGLTEYWSLLRRGADAIREVPASHWNPDDFHDADPARPDHTYARRGGFLEPFDFNPGEFGIAPSNLSATDASQLLSLAVAQGALRDAGYGPERDFDRSRVSVVAGVTGALQLAVTMGGRLAHPTWRRALEKAGVPADVADGVVREIGDSYVVWQENTFPGLLGNVVAGRIANRFNLGGANCVVDAACASSVSALHLAQLELETGRSSMVVCGGADTFNDIFMYMCFSKTPALSPTGDARPFSDSADGTILGEGIGMVVLKRLDDARRDGDRVYAVIKGIGRSSDGRGKAIYAPSAEGQERCLRDAYAVSGVSPATVELVEAHGTGTKVGDAVELSALRKVYREARAGGVWCALGSVKSQIGHTKAAAGVAALIKTALALRHKVLPPTIKVERPAPSIAGEDSPFSVNVEKRPWLARPGHPRRAALSSFGFGGSNFHMVLEEAEERKPEIDWDGRVQILSLSDATVEGLREKARAYAAPLEWRAFRERAAASRKAFSIHDPHRLVLVVEREKTDLPAVIGRVIERLGRDDGAARWSTPEGAYFGRGRAHGKLAFLFPGQGSQYVGMCRDLACLFPKFQDVLTDANVAYGDMADLACQLGDFIFPHAAFVGEAKKLNELALRATHVAQPAIGAVSLGMIAVLTAFGVHPAMAAGHSFGELVALFAGGRISAEDFHRLANLRGRLMAEGEGDRGSMLAVQAEETAVAEALGDSLAGDAPGAGENESNPARVVVANRNAPAQVVLSGATDAIERAEASLRARGISCKRLPVAAAFHSELVAGAAAPFREALERVAVMSGGAGVPGAGAVVYSNSTAEPYPDSEEGVRDLLGSQLARPVEFVRELRNMHAAGARTFVEVGPGNKMTGLARTILGMDAGGGAGADDAIVAFSVDASSGRGDGVADLARALAQLAALGHDVDLAAWESDAVDPLEIGRDSAKMTVKLTGANVGNPYGEESIAKRAAAPATVKLPAVPASARIDGGLSVDVGTKERPSRLGEPTYTPAAPARSTPSIARDPRSAPSVSLASAPPPAPAPAVDLPPPIAPRGASGHAPANVAPAPTTRPMRAPDPNVPTPPPRSDAPNAAPSSGYAAAPPDDFVLAAFRASQDHLAALQRMQEQTAQLHLRFLEGQQTALGTFQSLLSQQQDVFGTLRRTGFQPVRPEPGATSDFAAPAPAAWVAQASSPVSSSPPAPRTAATPNFAPPPAPSYPPHPSMSAPPMSAPVPPTTPTAAAPPAPSSPARAAIAPEETGRMPVLHGAAAPAADRLREVMLAVVSEKTGYPVEMIGLDMDLEADLGVDSIKRVEILSAVTERMPELPEVKPDEIGALRTLGAIAEYLGRGVAATPAASSAPAASSSLVAASFAPPTGSCAPGETGRMPVLREVMLAVVADKTGYPVEMIGLDMDLEADLGVDSIKRVEILSAVTERMPGLPEIKPEELGALRTLGEIVARMAAGFSEAPATSAAAPARSDSPSSSAASTRSAVSTASTASTRSTPAPSILPLLVAVVAEKTGYPADMIDAAMDLEADLGIDSIKRVEIMAAVQERSPSLPALEPEALGRLRTLAEIAAALAPTAPAPTTPASSVAPASSSTPSTARPAAPAPAPTLVRYAVVATPTDERPAARPAPLAPGALIVAGAGDDLHLALEAAFERAGVPVALADLASPPSPEDLSGVAGLVIVAPPAAPRGDAGWIEDDERFVASAFALARDFAAALRPPDAASSAPARRLFATVSRLDGAFGLGDGECDSNPAPGALAGLAKTVAREWPGVEARALDLAPELEPRVAALALVEELLLGGPVEIGLSEGGRVAPRLVEAPHSALVPAPGAPAALPVAPGEVVVVTGGARGVTAEVAVALAEAFRPTLVLLGRSPAPVEEPEWLRDAEGEAAMKRAIVAHGNGSARTPAEVERTYRRWAANREVASTLERVAAAGARVVYLPLDVRCEVEIADALHAVRGQFGPVRGIVHGAGVLADRLLVEKTDEQFASVFGTKVAGLRALLAATTCDDLAFLALFSSVSGRFGRRGQADYAMANEFLNKVACREAALRPGCRVVAVGWGPWDGGMVQGGLRSVFEKEGVGLIPLEEGARFLVEELRRGDVAPEVIVAAGALEGADTNGGTNGAAPVRPVHSVHPVHSTPATGSRRRSRESRPRLAFERRLDVDSHPVLRSHVVNGRAVLPMALMVEWLGHAALHEHPGLHLAGLDDLRVMQGVKLGPGEARDLRAFVSPATRVAPAAHGAELLRCVVELVGGAPERPVPHARAEAILSPALAPAPAAGLVLPAVATELTPATLYRELFHGEALHGIRAVETCGPDGIAGVVAAAPRPEEWMSAPPRTGWIADPLALDAAFQFMVFWTKERFGMFSLPTGLASYRQFARRFPEETRVVIAARRSGAHAAGADMEFLAPGGELVARVAGYECVMDAALADAFRRDRLSDRVVS